MDKYNIYLGSVGWEHEDWAGRIYPDDLPAEWMLSFYNTLLRCVYLPYEMWKKATPKAIEGWLAETQEGFRFVLEVPAGFSGSDKTQAGLFGERGVREDEIKLIWVEGMPNLRELGSEMLSAYEQGIALYVISRDADPSQIRQLNDLIEVLGL